MRARVLAVVVLPVLAVCGVLPGNLRADLLYSQNFNSFASGSGSVDGWWNYFGPGNTTADFGVDSNGVGGSQALYMMCNAAGEVGTDWYFYAGVGRSDMATPATAMPNARDQDVQFTLSLMASNANNAGAVSFQLSQWNPALGGNVWTKSWTPTLAATGYTTVTVTLDTGTDNPSNNVGKAASVFDPTLPISLNAITFNSGGFPLAANVGIHVDNVGVSTLMPGDANGDGRVDLSDLAAVLNNFGTSSSLRRQGNFDGAATINATDLSDVLANFGRSAPTVDAGTGAAGSVASAVPEPASVMLLGAAGALVFRSRRRS